MDASLTASLPGVTQNPAIRSELFNPNENANQLVLDRTLKVEQDPAAKISFSVLDLPQSLTVTSQEVVQKLNELLSYAVPDGIESLKQEDFTPEATADRIVQSATAFFDLYAEQHPELEGEELLNSFMDEISAGIDQGYGEAFDILEGLGAFEIEGVREGIEATRTLIDEKLLAYEAQKREELGLEPIDIGDRVSEQVSQEVLTQSGTNVLDTLA